MTDLQISTDLSIHTCGGCGWTYGIPSGWHDHAKSHGLRWRCPNKLCSWESVGYQTSELQKVKDQLAQRDQTLAFRQERIDSLNRMLGDKQRQNAALRGVVTRTKKRIGHGVCPCCKRTFSQLSQHMKTKHPHYGKA